MRRTRIVTELKKLYPHPVVAKYLGSGYCIGGSLIAQQKGISAEEIENKELAFFPSSHVLAKALRKQNPSLSKKQSIVLATDIIRLSDAENYRAAYGFMNIALTMTPVLEHN